MRWSTPPYLRRWAWDLPEWACDAGGDVTGEVIEVDRPSVGDQRIGSRTGHGGGEAVLLRVGEDDQRVHVAAFRSQVRVGS